MSHYESRPYWDPFVRVRCPKINCIEVVLLGRAADEAWSTYLYSRSIYPFYGLCHELRALGFTHKTGLRIIHILQLMKHVSQLITFPHEKNADFKILTCSNIGKS